MTLKDSMNDSYTPNSRFSLLLVVILAGIIATVVVVQKNTNFLSLAAGSIRIFETESGVSAGMVAVKSDATASNGQYIEFGTAPVVSPAPSPVTGTNTTTSSSGTSSTFQPQAPYYATFFYPWYENPSTDGKWSQWTDRGHRPPQNWFSQYLPDPNPSAFDPANELYSSNNDQIIYWQLSKLKEAKQEVAIASWWGQSHKTNAAVRKIITDVMNRSNNPYRNLRWAIFYEKEGFGNIPVSELVDDLNYIKNNFANQPAYFKIQNKPVIFVYNAAHSGNNPQEDLSRWKQARAQTGFYVVMKTDALNSGANAADMDSWYEYAPAVRTNTKPPYWYMVSPGFWLDGNAERLPRDAAAFEAGIKSMVSANVTWKLTETWNEWGEGSGVEPAEQVTQTTSGTAALKPGGYPFKNFYVDILARNLPPLEQETGAQVTTAATPVPTPVVGSTGTGGDPAIAAAGDIVCNPAASGAACKHRETADVLGQINPVAVLLLGDNQYEAGEYQNFLSYYEPTWGKFKAKTYPSVGNHEYGTAGASGYFDYFNGVGNATGRAGDRTKGYYAIDIGRWRLYALNSNCSKVGGCQSGSPQETWLRQDLQAHSTSCALAFWHHPRFSSGYDGNNASLVAKLNDLWRTLYEFNADVVLVGHSHHYERFAPQTVNTNGDPVSDAQRGIREFVVGTGGRNFTGFWGTAPNSEVKQNNAFGVLKLTLHPTSYDWEFKPIAGASYTDKGTESCH